MRGLLGFVLFFTPLSNNNKKHLREICGGWRVGCGGMNALFTADGRRGLFFVNFVAYSSVWSVRLFSLAGQRHHELSDEWHGR